MVSKIPKYYLNNKNLQTALGNMNRAYSTFEINKAYGRNFGNPYCYEPSEFKDKFTLPKNFEEAWLFNPDPWLRTM
jgi:hypothetical protein